MPKISELNITAFPTLEHYFPAAKDGETVRLSLQQVRDLLAYTAEDIAAGDVTVEEVLTALTSQKADKSYVDSQDNALGDAISTLASTKADKSYVDDQDAGLASELFSGLATAVRTNASQTFNPAQKGQALANIGAGILSGFRNKVINGDFNIWQRATSQANSGYGSDDRWSNIHNGTTKTHARVSFAVGQTEVPGNPEYHSRTTFTAGSASSDYCQKIQVIEGVETLAGKKVTLTFYARSPSASGLKLASRLFQTFGTGGTPSASVTIDPVLHSLTTAWQKFTRVIDVPSIAGKTRGSNNDDGLGVSFWFDAGSDHNATSASIGHQSGIIDIAHVSVVEGDATKEVDPFPSRHITQEEALCCRYFEILNAYIIGNTAAGGFVGGTVWFKSSKRIWPTVSVEGVIENTNIGTISWRVDSFGARLHAPATTGAQNSYWSATCAFDAEL